MALFADFVPYAVLLLIVACLFVLWTKQLSSFSFVSSYVFLKSFPSVQQRPPGGEEGGAGEALWNRKWPQPALKLQGKRAEG